MLQLKIHHPVYVLWVQIYSTYAHICMYYVGIYSIYSVVCNRWILLIRLRTAIQDSAILYRLLFYVLMQASSMYCNDVIGYSGCGLHSQWVNLIFLVILVFSTSFVIKKIVLMFSPGRLISLKNCLMCPQKLFFTVVSENSVFFWKNCWIKKYSASNLW